MSECTVSAVLIVKNADKYLLKCIQSLEKKMDEIIIVDTGSTDESKKIEMQIKKSNVLRSQIEKVQNISKEF